MDGGKEIPLLVLLTVLCGCAVPDPQACVTPCETLDAQPLLFGLDRFHFRMFENAAQPLIAAIGPESKTTDTPEESYLVRGVERYPWRDCVFRASFYFEGLWSERALAGVRLQIAPDASQSCFGQIESEIGSHFAPPHSLLDAARTGWLSAHWANKLERFDGWEDRPDAVFQSWVRLRKLARPVALHTDRATDAVDALETEPSGAGDIFLMRVDTRPQEVSRVMTPEQLHPPGLRG